MADEQKYSAFYADLDTIFDTRLALLYEFGESYVDDAFKNGYLTRIIDRFPGISYNEFKEKYGKRDKRILRNAMRTKIVDMILEYVKETHRSYVLTPYSELPKIIINTYPYKLTEDEESIIIQSFINLTSEQTDISIIHLSVDEMTPEYIKSADIAMMAVYDYVEWLETMSKNGVFNTQSCPDVGMLSPAILFKEPTQQELGILKNGKTNPFKDMSTHVEGFVKLALLSIDHFSIAL